MAIHRIIRLAQFHPKQASTTSCKAGWATWTTMKLGSNAKTLNSSAPVICAAINDPGTWEFPKITVNYFEPCMDYPDPPCHYENLTFFDDPDDEMLYISGFLILDKVIPEDTELTFNALRCLNEKSESCKKEFPVEVPDFCTQLPDKTKFWAPFITGIENFDPNCPIQMGKYVLKDAVINTTAMESSTSTFMGHWQFEIKFVSQDSVLGCMLLDTDITMRRSSG